MSQTMAQKTSEQRYMQTAKGREANRRKCARYRQTKGYKRAQAKYRAKRYKRDMANGKTWARSQVAQALTKGDLIRPDYCENCGKRCKPLAHHDDYSKPLNVRWLCQDCDRRMH